ncbi:hypothetical protein N7532_005870 [Penicillium argentinense]|uniref:Uncharacterized protein n=1 Tax=Penicillium argentinense TaxID=1131581 RepID=A0A9W9FF03_9EURO|nr:uncharacterized protein N7532_005870 [Penicillium argentinense]KAJ5098869.1 hypothetical protein N7532_005870 [Penicillium argentinense]
MPSDAGSRAEVYPPLTPSHLKRNKLTPTKVRGSDATRNLWLFVYDLQGREDVYVLMNAPGLPVVPDSPFYRALEDLWAEHGSSDARPTAGLIQAVSADIHHSPGLADYAVFRTWRDEAADLQYVMLQTRGCNADWANDGSRTPYAGSDRTVGPWGIAWYDEWRHNRDRRARAAVSPHPPSFSDSPAPSVSSSVSSFAAPPASVSSRTVASGASAPGPFY